MKKGLQKAANWATAWAFVVVGMINVWTAVQMVANMSSKDQAG